jgi:hypothetical protein
MSNVRPHCMRWSLRAAICAVIALPVVSLAAFPPARRLFPSIVGLDCDPRGVCAESPERLRNAELLYDDSKQFVQGRLGTLERAPRTIFCGSDWCASYFGLSGSKAQTTGPFGTVIGPHAWLPYLVRHELIHQVQNERMGMFRLRPGPEWFLEGMAFSLSDDPRTDLGPPWHEYRARFGTWYTTTTRANLWAEAAKLR